MNHVSLDHYVLALRDDLPLEIQVQQAHQHLLEICDVCRREWRSWHEETGRAHPEADCESLEVEVRQASSEPLHVSVADVEVAEQRLADRRAAARLARVDLTRIRRQPMAAWPRQVTRARRRYRSRAFGELLLAESRAVVRTAPREAEALAALIPMVISRRQGHHEPSWARDLRVRALAHQANALRVAGDLPAADSMFCRLHRQLAVEAHGDLDLAAETASLEASLRSDQRHFELAKALLDRALSAYRMAGNANGFGRTLIKQGILHLDTGLPSKGLRLLESASEHVDPADIFLVVCIVTARLNALCDLERYGDAGDLLSRHEEVFRSMGDEHVELIHDTLRARIDFGSGRFARADLGFARSYEKCIHLDRTFDACMASLYRAHALLAAGRTAAVRRLARDLVPLFAARGVARETFAAIRLLAA